jgi:hypothetical protein
MERIEAAPFVTSNNVRPLLANAQKPMAQSGIVRTPKTTKEKPTAVGLATPESVRPSTVKN